MSSQVYRLYIAEYERTPAWMSGGSSAFLKYVKPYDHYCIYITGRSKLPPDHYRATLEILGDQCEIIDATEMPDPDLRMHMAGRIEEYATDDTYVYFLGCDTDYAALKGKVSHWKSFSQLGTFRTGRLDLPVNTAGKEVEQPSRKLFPDMMLEARADEKKTKEAFQDEPEVRGNEKKEESGGSKKQKKQKRPDNKQIASQQPDERAGVRNNSGDRISRKGKKQKNRRRENDRHPQRETTDPGMMDLFFQGLNSVHVGDTQGASNSPPKSIGKEENPVAGKEESREHKREPEDRRIRKDDPTDEPPKRDREEREESKESWRERISSKKEEKTEQSQDGSMIQALEKAIFGVQQSFTTPQKRYSELDDSKARTVSLMADRLISNINLLVPGIMDFHFSYEDYMELIATLVKSDSLNDFQEGWSIVHPGCRLKLTEEIYRAIRNEANYYAKTCDVLYGEDCW